MTAGDILYLTGTIGYFSFAILAISILIQWHREQGHSWLAGIAGLLAVGLIAAVGGFLIIGTIRVLAQNEQFLSSHDSRIIAGAAPWMAFIFLAGRKFENRIKREGR